MIVKLAKTAGFCMGVRRAMEMTLAESNKKDGPLFTYGPLIHNNQVLELLSLKGVKSINNLEGIHKGRIIIRAHGIPPNEREALKNSGLKLLDATCPKVAKVQSIVQSYTKKGYAAVIVGDKNHAETIGLTGHASGPVYVINNIQDIRNLPALNPVFVVAQTTQDEQNFNDIVGALKKRFPDILVFDTICDATHQRQSEVRSFAGEVDALVVVGGYQSANTKRLAEISRNSNLPTFHVETEKDLDLNILSEMNTIGVTAGASTPNWMIKNVVSAIEGIRNRRKSSLFHLLINTVKLLVMSNVLAAFGAFSFCCFASILSKNPNLAFPFITLLYIHAMHVFNRFFDKGASSYNDPERAVFLIKHKNVFVISGLAAITTAFAVSYCIGIASFIALASLSFLGISYSISFIPKKFRLKKQFSKIKDIPASRSLFESLGWLAVISLLPLINASTIDWPAVLTAGFIVFLLSFFRAAFFEILQAQGDLIAGVESLPITLGEKNTIRVLKSIILALTIILLAAPAFGLVDRFSLLILISVYGLFFCLFAYEKQLLYPRITLEALVELNFILSGAFGIIWLALT